MVNMQLPWPGPRPYTDDLTEVFRGRDKELSRLLTQLQGQRLSLMTASSGAGKTSLLQAGLIPRIREYRIKARRKNVDLVPASPFPLLLNQWLERAGKGEKLDYSHLIILEMHRHLRESLDWYSRRAAADSIDEGSIAAIEAESAAIKRVVLGLAEFAEKEGFGRAAEGDSAELIWVDCDECPTRTSDQITDTLVAALDIASEHLGEILLILDQFEEVLLDWRLGQQALEAIESVYLLRRRNLRQLLSMRHDGLHLVDPLEAKGLLEPKIRVKIEPLSQSAVAQIIREISGEAGYVWDEATDGPSLLDRLITAFTHTTTSGGTRAGEVSLVGLQVVLNGLFRAHLSDASRINERSIKSYCATLSNTDDDDAIDLSCWLEGGQLANLAPRSWIVRCLSGVLDTESEVETDSRVYPLQIQPLAAKMSWLLVTPAGNKRTMTAADLHKYAYQEEYAKLDSDDLAGEAWEKGWSLEKYLEVMRATCDESLARLARGNVLKMRGSETGEDIAYELVHDQFGKPFQEWAKEFDKSPENDLSSLHALRSRAFAWENVALRPHDDDGVIPYARWEDCTIKGVDLSELTFRHCDFGESLFHTCTFGDVHFEECDLTNSSFRGCTFKNVTFNNCTLTASSWSKGTSLEAVVFHGGIEGMQDKGMSFVTMRNITLKDCSFSAEAGLLDEWGSELQLPMRNIQVVDCQFEGENNFERCLLDGGTLKGYEKSSRINGAVCFNGCRMASFEMSLIDVQGRRLQFRDCDCRGAKFDRIDGGRDEHGVYADIDFLDVELIGATMTGCELEDVRFVGRKTSANSAEPTDASTFVISDRPKERRSDRVASQLAKIVFKDLDAENMSIERCNIVGDITFDNCMLSGATFVGDPGHEDEFGTRAVRGNITFKNGCDLSAAEFSGIKFTDEYRLTVMDSIAQGALFTDVSVEGRNHDAPGALIDSTDLTGARFLGCSLNYMAFVGETDDDGQAKTSMPTVHFLPGKRRKKQLKSTMSRVLFQDIAMPGFVIQETTIEDDLRFQNCDLGGGTIGRLSRGETKRLRSTGDLHFANCRMDAIEISFMQFTDESIRIKNCNCRGALFQEIGFDLKDNEEDGLLIEDSDLTGVLFLDCQITKASLLGRSIDEPTPGVTMTFRESVGDRAELGHSVVENYVLDGGSFEGLAILDSVEMRNCSLLRTKFEDIEFHENAFVDVTDSVLLYAQVDSRLVADEEHFRMSEPQRAAIEGQLRHHAQLELRSLPETG